MKILHTGKFLRLVQEGSWEYVQRVNCHGIAVLVPVTDDQKIVLVEQFRIPLHKNVIELPAGLIGDVDANESLSAGAARELEEETGYRPHVLEEVFEGPISSGLSGERMTFFKASRLEKVGAGGGDPTELITVHEVPLTHLTDWLAHKRTQGILIDPKIYIGLYFLSSPLRSSSANS